MEQTVKVTPVDGYDIAVCGGGIAGIAAALAAARHGKKVVLLERQYMLGGLATAGLITIYLPLCDGCGKQVSFGIAEELLKMSIKHGAEARYPKNWLDGEGTRTKKDCGMRCSTMPSYLPFWQNSCCWRRAWTAKRDVPLLQEALQKDGVILHERDIL